MRVVRVVGVAVGLFAGCIGGVALLIALMAGLVFYVHPLAPLALPLAAVMGWWAWVFTDGGQRWHP